ncbi:MAG: integrase [Oleispira sp.]|jgi:integrase
MARITTPLSDTQIKQAKPKEKEYSLNDGQGLALRIKPTGSKLWIFNYYQPFTKKRKNMGLGKYPDVSLASARQKRNEARQFVSENIDPLDNREQQTDIQKLALGNTLEHIAKQWIEVKRSSVSDDHANKTWNSLELHIFPSLGKYPIDKLTAKKVIEQLSPIAAKGSLETIKRLCQRLNEIMIFAVNTGLIDSNPLSGIGKAFKTPEKQHLATIKPEELPALMQTINRASIKRVTRYLIEWQLHTLTRPSEAAGARWDEIDFNNAIWVIPAERMKKRREHSIPLTAQALEILEQIKPISGHREFVFPSDRNPRTHINSQTANMALKRMGYENKLVAHGLRALGSTILNEYGFDYDLVEAALAHVDKNEVRAAYNRADYIKRRIPMMEWWSEHIESSLLKGFITTSKITHLKQINS